MKKYILVSAIGLLMAGSAFAKTVCSAMCEVGVFRSDFKNSVDYSVIGIGDDLETALKNLQHNCDLKKSNPKEPTVLWTSAGKRSAWDSSRAMDFDIKKACAESK